MSKNGMSIIVAPHPDDEIIGCYEVLKRDKHVVVIYGGTTKSERRGETSNLKKFFENVHVQLFQNSIPTDLMHKDNVLYFPDPTTEIHPLHRSYGFQGESIARAGFKVVFYTTQMNVPYIHEVEDPKDKKMYLESCYPSQADLWKYDHKYFLFEGYCRWMF